MKEDPRIDAYIAKSADFAKPILNHLRNLAHAGCPGIEETLKWGMPSFVHEGIVFGMAAFKQHCTVHFWKGDLIFSKAKTPPNASGEAMGQFGRITSLSDLPGDKTFIGYVKKAVDLNEAGIKLPARSRSKEKKELVVPDYFTTALKKSKKALAAFENFSYSHRKEYVQWITEAKREETREQRLATAIKWLAEGKSRNWKYADC